MIEPVLDLLSFNNHRAKLVQDKFSAPQATTNLPEDHGTGRCQLHQQCHQTEQRREQGQSKTGCQNVEDVLDEEQVVVFGCRGKGKQRQIVQRFQVDFRRDMGKKAEHDSRLDALFLTNQEDFFQVCKRVLVHDEDHLVNDVIAQH